MSPPMPPDPATYELTIVGTLGPCLRAVLQPCVTASAEVQTIIRSRELDLLDLVLLLESNGLVIASISVLT